MARIIGDNENNFLQGSDTNDEIFGLEGDDILLGNEGDDLLYGGQGNDILFGGLGKDSLFGNKNNDILYGGKNDDVIFGGQGDDSLFGEAGNDTFYGDLGSNLLTGGAGNDRFVFQQKSGSLQLTNTNIITDFTVGQDIIQLQGISVNEIDFKDNGSGSTILQNQQTLEILVILQGVNSSSINRSILVSDVQEPQPTPQPTPPITPQPTPQPTPPVTPQPTPQPTPPVTPQPTPQPTPPIAPQPTPQPTPPVTPQPTPQPTPTVTPQPTPQPTPTVTPQPTPQPTPTVTPQPTPLPDTEPPQSNVNQKLQINSGKIKNITQAELTFTDNQQTDPTKIVYTLTNLPDLGELKLNGTVLAENQTFTQADINEGKLSYTQSKPLVKDQPVLINEQNSNNGFLSLANSNLFWFAFPSNTTPTEPNLAAFRFDGQEIVQLTNAIYKGGTVLSGVGEKFKDTLLLFVSSFDSDLLKIEGNTATSISPNTANNSVLLFHPDFYILKGRDHITDQISSSIGSKILVYDGTTTTPYTNEDFNRIDQAQISSVVNGKPIVLFEAQKTSDSGLAVYQSDGTQTLKLTPDLNFPVIDIYPVNNSSFFVTGIDKFVNGPPELHRVWKGEIFFFDGTNTTEISNTSTNNEPLFYRSGALWWEGEDGTGVELFKSDGITTTQITNNNYTQIKNFKQVGDSNVYLLEINDGITTHIFSYNTDTNALEKLTNDSTDNRLILDKLPGKSDEQSLYWLGNDGSELEFYRFNGTSVEKITNGNFSSFGVGSSERFPQLLFDDGDKVGVITFQVFPSKIYIANQETTQPLGSDNSWDTIVTIDENLGLIARIGIVDTATNTSTQTIVRYDWETDTTLPLTGLETIRFDFTKSDQNELFWSGSDGAEDGNSNDIELFRYDPLTNRNTQLTNQNFSSLSNIVVDSVTRNLYFREQIPLSEENSFSNNYNIYRYDLTQIPTSLTDAFQFTVSDSIQSTNSQSFDVLIS